MRNVATIKLTGAVVKADARQTARGVTALSLTVAGEYKSRDGSKSFPYYQRVDAYGKAADTIRGLAPVGTPVTVLGEVRQERWEDRDGNKRSDVRVITAFVAPLAGEYPTVKDAKGQARLAGGQNIATILGNLTRDPDMRYTPNGAAVTNFSVAVNERRGEEEIVSYFEVVAWNDLAQQAAELKKGQPVLIEGPIINETWTDKEGNKRYSTRFEAFTIHAIRRPAGAGKTDDPNETRPDPNDLAPEELPADEFPDEELPF